MCELIDGKDKLIDGEDDLIDGIIITVTFCGENHMGKILRNNS